MEMFDVKNQNNPGVVAYLSIPALMRPNSEFKAILSGICREFQAVRAI